MSIQILHDVAVSPNLAGQETHVTCSYAQTALLADGSIACLYRRGTTKHSHDGVLVVQMSEDFGRTWSEPVTVFDGSGDTPRETTVSGGICATGKDSLLVVFGSVLGLSEDTYLFGEAGMQLPRRARGSISGDCGRTWKALPPLRTKEYPRCGVAGSPLVLPDGATGIPVEVALDSGVQATILARWRPNETGENGWEAAEFALIAGDHSGQASLCDAHFTVLPNGDVLMLLWTFLSDERTVNVHRSVSSDSGLTWSPPEPTAIEGQVTVPLALPSETVIAASNYRHYPEGIYLWTSTDAGQTWGDVPPCRLWDERSKQIVAKEQPWHQAEAAAGEAVWAELKGFTFGTPDLELLGDGSVLLTYYATLEGVTHIRACRFRID